MISDSVMEKLNRKTLVRVPRRKATAYLATEALNVPGDFVEAGVFTGGTAIIMFGIMACNNATERTLWLADSFEGLPEPKASDLAATHEDWGSLSKKWTTGERKLHSNFANFNQNVYQSWVAAREGSSASHQLGAWNEEGQKKILAGWFADTLPTAPLSNGIAFLRCDADMYSSTYECLDLLYPKVTAGGLIYIDDYHEFPACGKAVDDYRSKHAVAAPMVTIVEDGDFHFVPSMTAAAVKQHKSAFQRGDMRRHIDAVFWRKGT
jgi:O-methyltransferase